jgi:hypothetical protein
VQFTSAWTPEEIANLQHEKMTADLKEYDDDCCVDWDNFKLVVDKYPDVFAKGYVTREFFWNTYAQVCTRSFGYGDDERAKLIPMADNLNHTNIKLSYQMITIQKHPNHFKVFQAEKPLKQQQTDPILHKKLQ